MIFTIGLLTNLGLRDNEGVFSKLGRLISHHPLATVVSWVLLMALAVAATFTGFGGKALFDNLGSGNPVLPNTGSAAVYEETEDDGASLLYILDGVPEEQLAQDTAVSQALTDLSRALEDQPGVASVLSYQGVASEIASTVEEERSAALAEVEAGFEEPQAEIDMLAQLDPEAAAAAQAELDAQKQAALDEVNEEVDSQLQSVLAGTAETEGDEAIDITSFLSTEGDGQIIVVQLEEGLTEEQANTAHEEVMAEFDATTEQLQAIDSGIEGYKQSMTLAMDAVIGQVQQDLITGESIGLPIALFIMIIVFGGLLAAGLPLIGALSTIALGMGGIWVLSQFTAVDSFVINIISIIGLGLSIDYGLLIVSRYREEIQILLPTIGYEADGSNIPHGLSAEEQKKLSDMRHEAIETTIGTAGRTVFFSALTIAISIGALLVMDAQILHMIALGGVITVLFAVAAAISLVPAIIVLLGNKLLRPSVLVRLPGVRRITKTVGDSASDHGFFSKLARFVHDRPWPILILLGALLVAMTIPVWSMHLRSSYDEYVPAHTETGQAIEILGNEYPAFRTSEIQILTGTSEEEAAGSAFVAELREQYPDARISYTDTGDNNRALINLDLETDDPLSVEVEQIVLDIRDMDAGFEFWVGGSAALQLDFNDSLADGLPLALVIIVVAVFVLLFLMTGSLMVPLKAILLNGLSLLASLGLTIWIFQNGFFGLEVAKGLEAYVVAIALAFGFGLAMDYEVFLLARIKEYWDAGYSNDESVERGLQRSGRIITSAAAIIIAVFIGFVFGELIMVKQVGVALAIIVGLDATLVRLLLVPATMTLLGKWNWWAPKPLVKIYNKFGIHH